jgi:hypothetical protein
VGSGAQRSLLLWLKTLGELTALLRSERRRPAYGRHRRGARQQVDRRQQWKRRNRRRLPPLPFTPQAKNINVINNNNIYNDKGYEPKEHMQAEAATSLILYWLVSLYLRQVIEFLAYVIATIYWGA